MMAALASAAMPNATIAGTRDSEQVNATDKGYGIDHAVVQDAAGKLYDTFASNTPKGRKRLVGRVRAAQTLMGNRELGGLGFDVDRVLAFSNGEQERSVTGDVSVMVATHHDGQARPLTLLTLDDCASVGTALGAIHRLRPDFLQEAGYPVFSTGQIRAQLTAWIKRLRQAGHVPQEITTSSITKKQLEALSRKPVWILDLAMPRDVEADCGTVEGVTLWNLDDLHSSTAPDETALAALRQIAEQYTDTFQMWRNYRDAVPYMQQLKELMTQRILHSTAAEPYAELPQLEEIVRLVTERTVDMLMGSMKSEITPELVRQSCAKIKDRGRF